MEASDFHSSWQFTSDDFRRFDESMDFQFYAEPRFCTHIDDGAIASLTEYYRRVLPPGGAILDICSSWISHLPQEIAFETVCGIGMNVRELEANKALTGGWEARDLNVNPTLPYADSRFDAVLNVVSVDYLTKPQEVFREMHRVLKPGGIAIMSFSNRCFASKAVRCWLDENDQGRMLVVGNYFHHSAKWESIRALDILPLKGDGLAKQKQGVAGAFMANLFSGDPMWVVEARAVK